tara:strand:+ start:758 stop:1144 length:387 start_codon:yes stop_codon:yes gene_type:complete
MVLEMIECPKCGNDFPKLRKEKYGYHVCVNCSTVKGYVGVTTVEGTGDHTYNDIIIMDQDQYLSIKRREAELLGKKSDLLELLDLEKEESEVSQSVKEQVNVLLDEDLEPEEDEQDVDRTGQIEGIDY